MMIISFFLLLLLPALAHFTSAEAAAADADATWIYLGSERIFQTLITAAGGAGGAYEERDSLLQMPLALVIVVGDVTARAREIAFLLSPAESTFPQRRRRRRRQEGAADGGAKCQRI